MRWNIRPPSFLTRPWCKDIKIQNINSKLLLLFLVKKCIFRLTQFMKKENNYKERREGWLQSMEMCQERNTTKIVKKNNKCVCCIACCIALKFHQTPRLDEFHQDRFISVTNHSLLPPPYLYYKLNFIISSTSTFLIICLISSGHLKVMFSETTGALHLPSLAHRGTERNIYH